MILTVSFTFIGRGMHVSNNVAADESPIYTAEDDAEVERIIAENRECPFPYDPERGDFELGAVFGSQFMFCTSVSFSDLDAQLDSETTGEFSDQFLMVRW